MSDDAHPHEIIIVKRHGGDHEDGHHGGAWKIAYADFVTAMMAFFLVMWLISANDKTRAVIARYFNPVQLVDSTPQPPGLNDSKDKNSNTPKQGGTPVPDTKEAREPPAPAAKPDPAAKAEPAAKPDAAAAKAKKEAELMKDPAAALEEIAAKDAAVTPVVARATGKAQAQGGPGPTGGAASQKGGEAFRDPFAPMSPSAGGDSADPAAGARKPADAAVPVPPANEPLPAEPQARAAELKARIEAVLKTVAAAGGPAAPHIEVKATSEGTLISLADDARFTMFESASAEPSPRTVTLLGRIGKLLKEQKGQVVIRGFTDGRKFKSDTYDNWRLSSARAHMAQYMLVRGGLEEGRVERIEGYADHQPRDAKNPDAPENRRIEILVRPS